MVVTGDEDSRRAEPLIISVESRKGGVGKTTAALCLATLLRRRGHAVLFIDADVTGTNAADAAQSPFWRDQINVIKHGRTDSKQNNETVNLIELFGDHFMAALPIPSFAFTDSPDTGRSELVIDRRKVNLLGSQIYSESSKGGVTCIEKPETLFDQLHTYWLLELVKELVADFQHATGATPGQRVAVILDNSPGYVGLAPAIQEWLTDRGPVAAKFLVVTSMDRQDIHACAMATSQLHNLYESKWSVSRKYRAAAEEGPGEFQLRLGSEAFFMRLASADEAQGDGADAHSMMDQDGVELSFFLGADDTAGQAYVDFPERYLGAVINKVQPTFIAGKARDLRAYAPMPDSGDSPLWSLLGSEPSPRSWRRRMVAYDALWDYQFVELPDIPSDRRDPADIAIVQLDGTLEAIERQITQAAKASEGEPWFGTATSLSISRVRDDLHQLDRYVSDARNAIHWSETPYFATVVSEEWMPRSIVPTFRTAARSTIWSLSPDGHAPEPVELDSFPISDHTDVFVRDMAQRLPSLVQAKTPRLQTPEHVIPMYTTGLAVLAGLSFPQWAWRPVISEMVVDLLTTVAVTEITRWPRRGGSSGPGVLAYLAEEASRTDTPEELIRFQTQLASSEESMTTFYRACAAGQARLMAAGSDSWFLVRLWRTAITRGRAPLGIAWAIREIAEQAVVRKSISHTEGLQRLQTASAEANYVGDFEAVLGDILSKWGVSSDLLT